MTQLTSDHKSTPNLTFQGDSRPLIVLKRSSRASTPVCLSAPVFIGAAEWHVLVCSIVVSMATCGSGHL